MPEMIGKLPEIGPEHSTNSKENGERGKKQGGANTLTDHAQ